MAPDSHMNDPIEAAKARQAEKRRKAAAALLAEAAASGATPPGADERELGSVRDEVEARDA